MSRNILRRLLIPTLIAAAAFAIATAAKAQTMPCGTHDMIVSRLADGFQEKQQAFGLVGNKAIVELFVSAKGSWTIIVTGTDGKTCVMAAGQGWESVPMLVGTDA